MQPAGQDPEARLVPATVTLPLCSRTKASPFWIMLLLVWGRSEHGMIEGADALVAELAGVLEHERAVTSARRRRSTWSEHPCAVV
jgi:hypothetical protein